MWVCAKPFSRGEQWRAQLRAQSCYRPNYARPPAGTLMTTWLYMASQFCWILVVLCHSIKVQNGRRDVHVISRHYECQHIEAEKKMVAIFQTIFWNRFSSMESIKFDWKVIEICSKGSTQQKSSIGSDNGLAPNRWRAIIWTNDS